MDVCKSLTRYDIALLQISQGVITGMSLSWYHYNNSAMLTGCASYL